MHINVITITTLIHHPIFLLGLQNILQQKENISYMGNIKEQDIPSLFEQQPPDILFISLKKDAAIETRLVQNLHLKFPELKIAVFRDKVDANEINNLIKAGASAIMLRNIREMELKYAIDVMQGGGTYVSQDISSGIFNGGEVDREEGIHHKIKQYRLTARELQIMQMIVKELTNLEISEMLQISPRTVETHRMNIISKIGAKNSIGIAKFYLRNKVGMLLEKQLQVV